MKQNIFLKEYLEKTSMFLCNDDERLRSFSELGGDWDDLINLVEERKVFYSKLYKNRVTYISNRLHWCMKPYKQRLEKISKESKKIFEFIETSGAVTTQEIKRAMLVPDKNVSKCMDELVKELLITAIGRDKKINDNWSSFYWGTYRMWEMSATKYKPSHMEEYTLLGVVFNRKEIQNILK